MGLFGRLAAPLARAIGREAASRQTPDLDRRFADLAGRLELHTLNLAEHQAQLRDEGLRRILDEVRANSAFLADSVVALEEASGRRAATLHCVVRPAVHQVRGTARRALCIGAVDPTLVDELAAANIEIMVVDPAMEFAYAVPVEVVNRPLGAYAGPAVKPALVVWVCEREPHTDAVERVASWIDGGGVFVLASPVAVDRPAGFGSERRLHATDVDGRFRLCGEGEARVVIDVLRAP